MIPGRWLFLLACLSLAPAWGWAEEVAVVQKPFEALSDQQLSKDGGLALALRPQAWLHGELPHFVLHYRRITEAKRVAIEIEFTSPTSPKRSARRRSVTRASRTCSSSRREGLEDVPGPGRRPGVDGEFRHRGRTVPERARRPHGHFRFADAGARDDARRRRALYPGRRWPLWLSEGFAEQMSGQSTGARDGPVQPTPAATLSFGYPAAG